MAEKSVFSTPRTQTADQMLEGLIQKKNAQRQNRMALAEANAIQKNTPDFTAIVEATNVQVEKDLKKSAMLERMAYETGSRNIAVQQLGIRQQMIQEGMEIVTNQVIGELIYESYWLDNPVKEATVEQIEESIGETWQFIEENFKDSRIAESKQSPLMKSFRAVIEATVKEAADRICKECESTDAAFPNFQLTDAEEERMDEKLTDLGRDEIVDIVKHKVAEVVQDEKEKGQERADMFKAIDAEINGDGDEEGELTETEEATLAGIRSGEITLEGATWDTLKVIFSDNKKKAKASYKLAARLAKRGQYDQAAKEYENAKKIFKEMLNDVKSADDSAVSAVCGFLLSGWLEHAFIASIGGPSTGVSITKAVCTALSAAFGLMIPFNLIMRLTTNEDNVKKDPSSNSSNDYKVHAIAALNLNIQVCDEMIKECKSKSRENHTVKEALTTIVADPKYTPGERHIAKLMEAGAPLTLFEDPTWGEFKSCISMLCKRIQSLLITENFCYAKKLIEELESKLSGVPETIPGEVKGFTMTMINIIYGAVPADEVVISRFSSPSGIPDVNGVTPSEDYYTAISWTDLFVNIKTNLSSIKEYCDNRCSKDIVGDEDLNNSDCPISGKNSLAQKVATRQTQILNQTMGGSLFEAMMIGSIQECTKVAMESASKISSVDVEDAALIETLLNYTVFETLDTIGMYRFRMGDINQAKQMYMHPVSEGVFDMGKDKKGLKKIRINTKKDEKEIG